MNIPLDFTGRNVLITGGTRGIGLATAIAFADCGANVALTYRSNEDAARAARKQIEDRGVRCKTLRAETADEEQLAKFVLEIVEDWGSLDAAVANAGIWNGAAIENMPLELYREMMEVNMTGSFVLSKVAARQMKRQHSGAIVLVSSTAGQRGEAEHSHYAASKGAQISFTKSLAPELAPFGIRVNCVAPGWVVTEMTQDTLNDPAAFANIRQAIPLGRAAQPKEIASAILFLASPMASFITGEILNVNGGAVLCG